MAREYPVKKGIKLSLEAIREKAESITGEARIDESHVFSRCPGLSEISSGASLKTFSGILGTCIGQE